MLQDLLTITVYGKRRMEGVITLLCLTLCDPLDCSLSGSSVHAILQARTLEWVAVPFSGGSSQHRDGI